MTSPLEHQKLILEELENTEKALIHIPSGAGKTHTAAFYVNDIRPKSFIYVVHRNEILQQSLRIFKEICSDFIDDENIGIIDSDNKGFGKRYIFATVQTLAKENNIAKLLLFGINKFDCVVIDEAHHVAARSYQKFLDAIECKMLLGLTATPFRHDKQDIKKYFNNNLVGNIDIFQGIQQNILVPFYYRGLYDNVNYDNIYWNGFKYNEFDLDKYLLIEQRDKAVIEQYLKYIHPEKERLTIAFCNSVNHVKRMVEKFNEAGIKSVGVSYLDDRHLRKNILKDFRNGHYKILFTRDILNEGVDFPECSALMFLRPTYSKTIFLQQLGRGLRKKTGKKNVLVLDFLGNYHNVHKVRDYLIEIAGKKNIHNLTGERVKPIYNMNLPIVEFDSRVVDIIEIEANHRYRFDNKIEDHEELRKRLIEQYYELKKLNNNQIPKMKDIQFNNKKFGQHIRYGRFWYVKLWGSYSKFLEEVENYFQPTKERLLDNYQVVKKWALENKLILDKVGVVPTSIMKSCPISKFNYRQYETMFVGYGEFLKYANEIPKDSRPPYLPTNAELDENWKLSMEKLGRVPKYYDLVPKKGISLFHPQVYTIRFKKWDYVLERYNIKKNKTQTHYLRKHQNHSLKDMYFSLKNELKITDRPLKWMEFYKRNKSEAFHIKYEYGTYSQMLQKFGELFDIECLYCGKKFLPQKSHNTCCSRICVKRYNDKVNKERRRSKFPDTKQTKCKECGNMFEDDYFSNIKYCSKECGRRSKSDMDN